MRAVVLITGVFAGCVSIAAVATPARAEDRAGVGVAFEPGVGVTYRTVYELQIGHVFRVVDPNDGGGVVSVPTARAVTVVLRRQRDCVAVISFVAPVGSRWVLRLVKEGTIRVEDATATGLDSGPGIGPGEPLSCLPDTGTAVPASQPATDATATLSVVTAAVAMTVGGWLAADRRRRRREQA